MNRQYWTEENPCAYCPATSNTSHTAMCPNDGLYNEDGSSVLSTYPEEVSWEQMKLGQA